MNYNFFNKLFIHINEDGDLHIYFDINKRFTFQLDSVSQGHKYIFDSGYSWLIPGNFYICLTDDVKDIDYYLDICVLKATNRPFFQARRFKY